MKAVASVESEYRARTAAAEPQPRARTARAVNVGDMIARMIGALIAMGVLVLFFFPSLRSDGG